MQSERREPAGPELVAAEAARSVRGGSSNKQGLTGALTLPRFSGDIETAAVTMHNSSLQKMKIEDGDSV